MCGRLQPYVPVLLQPLGLLVGEYARHATYYLLPTTYCLLPTAYCLLPTAYCLLLTTYYLLLLTTCYLLVGEYARHDGDARRVAQVQQRAWLGVRVRGRGWGG